MAMPNITIKLDVTKIAKDYFFKGAKGTYCDIALWDKPNTYGDDGYVTQNIPKEARDRGEKGPIIGNWKYFKTKGERAATQGARSVEDAPEQMPPF